MKTRAKIDFCPFCGNRSPKKLLSCHTYQEMGYVGSGRHDLGTEYPYEATDFVAKCVVCEHILLYNTYPTQPVTNESDRTPDDNDRKMFLSAELVYPETEIDKSIPISIRTIYEEALNIEQHSPSMFAVQIRKALEAICNDQGVARGKLYKRIKTLVDDGVLPASLEQASGLVRRVGNIGAHEVRGGVHPLEVNSIKSLFKAIVEYLYVYPSKLESFSKDHDKYRIWAKNLHDSQDWESKHYDDDGEEF